MAPIKQISRRGEHPTHSTRIPKDYIWPSRSCITEPYVRTEKARSLPKSGLIIEASRGAESRKNPFPLHPLCSSNETEKLRHGSLWDGPKSNSATEPSRPGKHIGLQDNDFVQDKLLTSEDLEHDYALIPQYMAKEESYRGLAHSYQAFQQYSPRDHQYQCIRNPTPFTQWYSTPHTNPEFRTNSRMYAETMYLCDQMTAPPRPRYLDYPEPEGISTMHTAFHIGEPSSGRSSPIETGDCSRIDNFSPSYSIQAQERGEFSNIPIYDRWQSQNSRCSETESPCCTPNRLSIGRSESMRELSLLRRRSRDNVSR